MSVQVRSNAAVRAFFRVMPSFEPEMLLLDRFVGDGDVCVDVGASYGLYTVALARLAGPTGAVHAFEPRPRSRSVLRWTTRLLAPGNVSIHAFAVGARDGEDVIVTPHRRWGLPVPGRSFLRRELGPQGGTYFDGWEDEFGFATEHAVDVRSLDSLLADRPGRRVSFVKIDVEGAELDVLEGARALLTQHRPVVLCEIEDRHTSKYGRRAEDVVAWLEAGGYTAHRLDGRDLRPVARTSADNINYLFLPGGQETAPRTSKPSSDGRNEGHDGTGRHEGQA